jgi:hypothetical protein
MHPEVERICNLTKSSRALALKSNDSLSSNLFESDVCFGADQFFAKTPCKADEPDGEN